MIGGSICNTDPFSQLYTPAYIQPRNHIQQSCIGVPGSTSILWILWQATGFYILHALHGSLPKTILHIRIIVWLFMIVLMIWCGFLASVGQQKFYFFSLEFKRAVTLSGLSKKCSRPLSGRQLATIQQQNVDPVCSIFFWRQAIGNQSQYRFEFTLT